MGEYKRQLLSLSLSLSLSVRACVRESECARARRYRGKPENNRPYTGSNLVRDTGYPKVSRGFPHSLHLNTRKLPETCHGRFLPSIFRTPSAAATLEPETTQHNSLDGLQTRKQKSNTLLFMSAATLKPIRLECYLSRLSGANKVSLLRTDSLARYLLQCA